MLKLENISKSFGSFAALRNVSLAVHPGSVHGLLGENGAGKSTLMNILFGLVRPDAGQVSMDGQPMHIHSPAAAQRLGIGMVHQHFKLVPTLTVLDNFALATAHGIGLVKRQAAQGRLEKLAASLGWRIDAARIVAEMSVGEQQRLEILKALAAGNASAHTRVLILDEPTAVLTPQEFDELAAAIKAIAGSGTAVIFISHKLAEVRTVCDELTILRRGSVVHTGATTGLSPEQIAEKMVGARVEGIESPRRAPAGGEILLALENVRVHEAKRDVVRAATFAVRAGEIVGIAGVDGNGQSELVRAIVGTHAPAEGSIRIAGEDATHQPVRWRMDRIAYIPEDRHRQALVLPLSVTENLMLKAYRVARFAPMGWIRRSAWDLHASTLAKRFDIRCRSIDDAVQTLSGGNQQKVVIARELEFGKRVVIAVNPTRGLDVGATSFVMRQLLAARDAGAAVLLVHSDLDELLAISDRVLVMYGGLVRSSAWPAATKEAIGRMMMGLPETPAGGRP